jgi:hypothetical protein
VVKAAVKGELSENIAVVRYGIYAILRGNVFRLNSQTAHFCYNIAILK